MKTRNYKFIYTDVVFDPNAKRGLVYKGNTKNGWINHGYIIQYIPSDDKIPHTVGEHIAKWEYFNGEIPDGMEIDHINGDKADNRLENLRCVPHITNCNNDNTKINITNALKKHFEECPEDKLRLSKLHKGKTPWNKGKTNIYSNETIQKLSDAGKINNIRRERNNLGQFIS